VTLVPVRDQIDTRVRLPRAAIILRLDAVLGGAERAARLVGQPQRCGGAVMRSRS